MRWVGVCLQSIIVLVVFLALYSCYLLLSIVFVNEKTEIKAARAVSVTDYWIVTLDNPLAPSHAEAKKFNGMKSLNASNAEKKRKYQ